MRWTQNTFIVAALLLIPGSIVFFSYENAHAGITTAVLAVILLFLALPEVTRIKAGKDGIELERKIQQVEVALADVQALAAALARAVIVAAEGGARWGGIPDELKTQLIGDLVEVLRRVQLPNDLMERALGDYHKYVAFDYAHYILGGGIVPDNDSKEFRKEFKALHGHGLFEVPTPKQLTEFLTRWNMLSPERREQILDYQHYLERQQHRRPDVWSNREDWGRLITVKP